MKSLGFYTEGPPFEGDALEKRALGGSETAFIEITRAFRDLGWEVTAVNNCEKPATHHGVRYYPVRESLPVLARVKFDVFVVSRFFGFFNLPINSRLKVLWNHDTLTDPKGLRAVQDEIDLCFVLSKFHRDNYLTRVPQLDDRTLVTRNGLNLELMDEAAAGAARDPDKLIYASRPERGLKILLEDIWPRLKEARPSLKLHLCGYSLSREHVDPGLLDLYDYLELLTSADPSIVPLGALNKKDYYRHLKSSALMVYPCVFPEISCLVSLEAQALGTPILTSGAYALNESVVQDGFKIQERPGSRRYAEAYVERALKLLDDPVGARRLAEEAQKKIRERYSWAKIAREWERVFNLSLKARESRRFLTESPKKGASLERPV
ncbi:MAG: glycosyltransferase family 4 protein [Deltaproteobacteria bacterium]|nr:glycosyltransferase family 4 protein [Deltaproteobacteria bacterium]